MSEILTVTNRDFFFKTEDEYREMATVANKDITNSFILEPFGRNTAPAIAAAALQLIETHGEQAILLVLAADHLIHDELSFAQAVTQAVQLSEQNKLVVFGIKPELANTGKPIKPTPRIPTAKSINAKSPARGLRALAA